MINIDSLKDLNITHLYLNNINHIKNLEVLLTLKSLKVLSISPVINSTFKVNDELKNYLNYIKTQRRKRIISEYIKN